MEICDINQHNPACDLIRGCHGVMLSQEEREMFVRRIDDEEISLSDMICSRGGQAGGVSLFQESKKHRRSEGETDSL